MLMCAKLLDVVKRPPPDGLVPSEHRDEVRVQRANPNIPIASNRNALIPPSAWRLQSASSARCKLDDGQLADIIGRRPSVRASAPRDSESSVISIPQSRNDA